jgi:hypothetical protein
MSTQSNYNGNRVNLETLRIRGLDLSAGGYTHSLPEKSGTISHVSDLDDYLPLTGGTMSGNIQFVDIGYIYTESVDTSVGVNIIDGTDVSLQWNGTGSFTNLTINNTDSIPVTSTKPLFRGIEYNTDFSPNYTDRSLVDKEYTDGTVNRSKYAATFSFTAGVTQSINHGLNSYDIIISLWDYNTGDYIIGSYRQTSANIVDIQLSSSMDVRVIVL